MQRRSVVAMRKVIIITVALCALAGCGVGTESATSSAPTSDPTATAVQAAVEKCRVQLQTDYDQARKWLIDATTSVQSPSDLLPNLRLQVTRGQTYIQLSQTQCAGFSPQCPNLGKKTAEYLKANLEQLYAGTLNAFEGGSATTAALDPAPPVTCS